MIIDRRAGSCDLYPQLQMVRPRIPDLELGDLTYGDIQLIGNGPEGAPVLVGVEYKKLGDLCQCIDNGRFVGHQLPGMLECYQVVWLLVEGIWREGRDGGIEVPRGPSWRPISGGRTRGFSASSLYGFLFTLQQKMGVRVMQTGTLPQTVRWLSALNRWWTEKEWEEHRAHLAFDQSTALSLISRPSLVRRVAKELPGVGWGRSGSISKHFDSVVSMVNAPTSEWEGIEGIGKTTAAKIVKALDGEEG